MIYVLTILFGIGLVGCIGGFIYSAFIERQFALTLLVSGLTLLMGLYFIYMVDSIKNGNISEVEYSFPADTYKIETLVEVKGIYKDSLQVNAVDTVYVIKGIEPTIYDSPRMTKKVRPIRAK